MTVLEFNAEEYNTASRHQKEWGRAIISELDLRGNQSVLDLGCGDGVLTAELSRRVPDGYVVGIDSSWNMVRTARKLQRECDNLSFQLMDINYVCAEDAFDLVFSNAALHWVKDHRRMMRNLYDSLKAGGALRLNFAGDGNCATFIAVVREAMADDRFARHFERFEWPWYMPSADEYEVLIRQLPFSQIAIWEQNADRCFASVDEMVRWIDQPSLVPFLECVGDDDAGAFRERVVSEMAERTLRANGTCFETFRRINVKAIK